MTFKFKKTGETMKAPVKMELEKSKPFYGRYKYKKLVEPDNGKPYDIFIFQNLEIDEVVYISGAQLNNFQLNEGLSYEIIYTGDEKLSGGRSLKQFEVTEILVE